MVDSEQKCVPVSVLKESPLDTDGKRAGVTAGSFGAPRSTPGGERGRSGPGRREMV